MAARIEFGVTLTLTLLVVGVGGPAVGLILRLSWGDPALLLLESAAAAIAVYVWFLPEEVNPVRLLPVLIRGAVVLRVLRIGARFAQRRVDRFRAAEAKVQQALDEAIAEQALTEAGREPQREAHDTRVYPPQT
jgi:hypothetical protein